MSLHISKSLSLPIDAVTQTFAIVARKRVGKTYTASVMAEEFVKSKIPIVVLDPTGAWWGLRSSSDGSSDGFPVVIVGGNHADVPLDEHAGKIIADLVVDHPGFYIIDFCLTDSEAAQDRFATDFGTHFYRRKESSKFPLHLFIDEADSFMPQRPFPGQQRMLGAFDTIVRRGGIRGIGVTMITQRPAVLNKNALTQAETLIALQMSGAQDIDAIEHWIRVHGTKEQRDEVIGSLASLHRGECWVWSPSWLEVLKRVTIRERETFNSSATPKVGEKTIIAPKLAAVDIEKLGERIMSAAQKIKDNDPTHLKREIAALKKQVAEKPVEKVVEKSVLKGSDVYALNQVAEKLSTLLNHFTASVARLKVVATNPINCINPATRRAIIQIKPEPLPGKRTGISNGDVSLGKCERALLSVLAKFPEGCNRRKLILLAGYAWSGSTQNALGKLRSLGLVEGHNSGQIKITVAGESHGPFELLARGEDLIRYWINFPHFGKCERELLRVLSENPDGLDRERLLELSGYEWSGSTQNALGTLRTAEVITGRNNEVMRLSEELLNA